LSGAWAKKLNLFSLGLRSHFLQSAWNFERLQNLGLLYALAPYLKKLYPNSKTLAAAFRRHLTFFSTNPYMAPFLLGALVKLEEEYQRGETGGQEIAAFKLGTMGPLAALGDTLFWGSLRPFLGALAAALALTGWWGAPLCFLVLYNLPHLFFRWGGLLWGYLAGASAVNYLKEMDFQGFITRLRRLMPMAAALVLALTLYPGRESPHAPILIVALLGAAYAFYFLLRRGHTPLRIVLVLFALGILLELLKVRV
jgi:PTS system mannose-specific IID component